MVSRPLFGNESHALIPHPKIAKKVVWVSEVTRVGELVDRGLGRVGGVGRWGELAWGCSVASWVICPTMLLNL